MSTMGSVLRSFLSGVVVALLCFGNAAAQQSDQEKERKRNNFIAFEVMWLIHDAEISYRKSTRNGLFADSEELFKQNLVSPGIAIALGVPKMKSNRGEECSGEKKPFHGYFFELKITSSQPGGKPRFATVGFPAVPTGDSRTGDYSFFIDDENLIRISADPKVLASARSIPVGDPAAPEFNEITNGIKTTIGVGSMPGQLFPDGTVCIADASDPSLCKQILFKVADKVMKKFQGENTASSFYGIFDLDNDSSPEVFLGYWLPEDPDCSPKLEEGCVHLFVYKKVGKSYRLTSKLQAPSTGYDADAWFLKEAPRKAIFKTRYQGSGGSGLFYLDLKKRSLKLMTDDIGVTYLFLKDLDNDGVREFFVLGRGPDSDRLGGGLLRWEQGSYRLHKIWWPRWISPRRLTYAELIKANGGQEYIVVLLESYRGEGHSALLELAVFKIRTSAFSLVSKVELPEAAASSEPVILQTSRGVEIRFDYELDEGKTQALRYLFRRGKITCDNSGKGRD